MALEDKAAASQSEALAFAARAVDDSIALANEKLNGRNQMDSMQQSADDMALANQASASAAAKKATADSLALLQAAKNLADEKNKRTDMEKRLLSTGELLLDAVYFETDKTIISINSKPYLNIIGKMLLKYPKLQIEIAGHTDNIGTAEYNLSLSQGRAEAVRSYLATTEPALSSKLTSHGYGLSMPKADNKTADGRLANRRVELRVTNTNALLEYSQR
jgi:outer membrane protein OmpA-like peptidoglycan-associated protein